MESNENSWSMDVVSNGNVASKKQLYGKLVNQTPDPKGNKNSLQSEMINYSLFSSKDLSSKK